MEGLGGARHPARVGDERVTLGGAERFRNSRELWDAELRKCGAAKGPTVDKTLQKDPKSEQGGRDALIEWCASTPPPIGVWGHDRRSRRHGLVNQKCRALARPKSRSDVEWRQLWHSRYTENHGDPAFCRWSDHGPPAFAPVYVR